jgi:hypothetical protein
VWDRPITCPRCKAGLRLRRRGSVSEETIASWLEDEEDLEDEEVRAPARSEAAQAAAAPVQTKEAERPRSAPAPTAGGIRLVKADSRGALFEFPASRLKEVPFRCAMPRRCLQCGCFISLNAHVILYEQTSRRLSLDEEHTAGRLAVKGEEVEGLEGEELLSRLPKVPNVPPPADLPMPYWLCDMCTGAGAISGRIQVNAEAGEGRCRLLIRNLWRAREFLLSAGGEATAGAAALSQRLETMTVDPWDTLPLVVRHRLEQWYHPREDEKLIAYIPNRDHARTEDGVSGLVISTRRIIYHSHSRHREALAAEPLEMQLAIGEGKGDLRFRTRSWQVKRFRVDRDGIRQLRRALTVGKFKVAWR